MKSKNIIVILLLFVFVASAITATPLINMNVKAATTMKTYPVSDAIPNPIGVGELTLLKVGISQPAPSASYGWSGITITVVKPNGAT